MIAEETRRSAEVAAPIKEGRSKLRAARRATLTVFDENPHGANWAERLIACIRTENEIAQRYGL